MKTSNANSTLAFLCLLLLSAVLSPFCTARSIIHSDKTASVVRLESQVLNRKAVSRSGRLLPSSSIVKHHEGKEEKNGQKHNDDMEMISKKIHSSVRGGGMIDSRDLQAIYGVIALICIERVVQIIFTSQNFIFPSMLGGCLFLFSFQLVAQTIKPGLGDSIFNFLTPAAALLSKWIGSFFVPGLVMLPLAPSVGSGFELLKVASVVVLGFVYSLSTVSFTVLGLRKSQGLVVERKEEKVEETKQRRRPGGRNQQNVVVEVKKSAPKVFSDATFKVLVIGSLLSFPTSILATKSDFTCKGPLQMIAMLFVSLTGYVWGARLPSVITKICHPILISAMIALLTTHVLAGSLGSTFKDVLKTFKVGSLSPLKAGAGDYLLYLLSPTVVSFSVSMYGRRKLIKENFFIILTSMLVASIGGLFTTAAYVRLISLGGEANKTIRLSVLTRNITTPLAIVISNMLGGSLAIAASMAIATAVIGGTYGKQILTAMGIHDPVTRGLAIGGAGQGLGVASLATEPDAFPFAAMSLVLNAIAATILVCIPPIKKALMNLALGTEAVV